MFELPYFDPNGVNDLDDFIELDIINLLHPNDPAYDYAESLRSPDGSFIVLVHGSNDQRLASRVFDDQGNYVEYEVISIEDVADRIVESGLWNGEPIILMACHAGKYSVDCLGQELSDLMGVLVYAPKTTLHLGPQNRYYVYDGKVSEMSAYELSQEYQTTMWQEFLPIVY